ncbi:hypothetical protein CG709_03370 [Lachnotalea glycerini]|nr:hypothetical protein CG709_03370 [Lachnotalea glycerini]
MPLSAAASRGDQILNAKSFQKQGFSAVLEEESLDTMQLIDTINEVYTNKATYINAMSNSKQADSIDIIINLIKA